MSRDEQRKTISELIAKITFLKDHYDDDVDLDEEVRRCEKSIWTDLYEAELHLKNATINIERRQQLS